MFHESIYTNAIMTSRYSHLEAQCLARLLGDSGLDVRAAEEGVTVWGRARAQRPLRRRVGTLAAEEDVDDHGIPVDGFMSHGVRIYNQTWEALTRPACCSP